MASKSPRARRNGFSALKASAVAAVDSAPVAGVPAPDASVAPHPAPVADSTTPKKTTTRKPTAKKSVPKTDASTKKASATPRTRPGAKSTINAAAFVEGSPRVIPEVDAQWKNTPRDKGRVRISLSCSEETLFELRMLNIDEIEAFGHENVPCLYHYFETAMLNFLPTRERAQTQGGNLKESEDNVELMTSTTFVVPEARKNMYRAMRTKNRSTGGSVTKTWYYDQALRDFIAARRELLGL